MDILKPSLNIAFNAPVVSWNIYHRYLMCERVDI